MTNTFTVKAPFALKKKEFSLGEFLSEILAKYENIEDALLGKLIAEGEKTKTINKKAFYKKIDRQLGLS